MDIQAAHLVRLLAGKSDPSGGGGWLPLWMHARDTAAYPRARGGDPVTYYSDEV